MDRETLRDVLYELLTEQLKLNQNLKRENGLWLIGTEKDQQFGLIHKTLSRAIKSLSKSERRRILEPYCLTK